MDDRMYVFISCSFYYPKYMTSRHDGAVGLNGAQADFPSCQYLDPVLILTFIAETRHATYIRTNHQDSLCISLKRRNFSPDGFFLRTTTLSNNRASPVTIHKLHFLAPSLTFMKLSNSVTLYIECFFGLILDQGLVK